MTQKYNTKNIPIAFALQTNGYDLHENWMPFFHQNRFLIGLSMDGEQATHDQYRLDRQGNGTHARVMHTAKILKKYQVDFNVLITVTEQIAGCAAKTYSFFKDHGFFYQQYIPCLDPIDAIRGENDYSLRPSSYGVFLKELFDCVYEDFKKGSFPSIRYFDNLLLLLTGRAAEACGMQGGCSLQYVVEADGSIYPCDFYALDDYKLGNIKTSDFAELDQKRSELKFLEQSYKPHPDCLACKWKYLCRGGCRRDRDHFQHGGIQKNYFCPSFQDFFEYAMPRLIEIARAL